MSVKEDKIPSFKTFTSIWRALFSFFIPSGLIILIAFLFSKAVPVESWPGIINVLPLIVLIAGIFLGWRFNKSHLVYVVVVLAFADWALLQFSAESISSSHLGQTVYNAVSFLLPLNLFYFCLVKERGLLSWGSMRRLALVAFQFLGVYVICSYPKFGFALYLNHSFFNWQLLSELPLAQPAFSAFVGTAFIILVRCLIYRSAIDCGFFWALISSFLAFGRDRIDPVTSIYLSSAGLVLIVSVIEISYGRAYQDELTGLPARRALSEALSKLGKHYTVAMVDIDHFKRFNDFYGHDVGDQVLRMIASKLESAPGGGMAYRYGGEEFAILFPGKSIEETIGHLERLRKNIQDSGFILRGGERRFESPKKGKKLSNKISVTVSIGVAERNTRYFSPQEVVKAADRALYRAKKKGRNRVCN